ncbi:MAG TPA: ATP synthase F1 subunit delta [Bacteroidetes bacterium]|nr:ATP synthase F1 subunit delta [Bacteroidota bacterium]
MIEIKLGDRYAKSIIGLAKERGEVEAVRNDFLLIKGVCESNQDFINMLKSPLINTGKKQVIMKEIFGGKLSEITSNFVEIVVRRKREAYLPDIATRFLFQYDLFKHITRGTVTSAAPLSETQRKVVTDLVAKESGSDFILTEKIDPELIGGFTLRIGDFLYDGSLSSRLRDLKQEFDNNPYVKQI